MNYECLTKNNLQISDILMHFIKILTSDTHNKLFQLYFLITLISTYEESCNAF